MLDMLRICLFLCVSSLILTFWYSFTNEHLFFQKVCDEYNCIKNFPNHVIIGCCNDWDNCFCTQLHLEINYYRLLFNGIVYTTNMKNS